MRLPITTTARLRITHSATARTCRRKHSAAKGALAGIKVLDLTRVLAGPYATMLLGDLGADVVKVEQPGSGDETRHWGPPFIQGESAYFLCANRNKRSVTVNFKSKEGIQIVKQLAAKSDVLVENYLPGKMDRMGLGYDSLSKLNKRLIYASITGYGQTGPYAMKPGYDVMIEAEAGLMYITGHPDGPPAKVGVAITDLTAGLYTKSAILAALLERQASGEGQHLDISLMDVQVASLANIASNYLIAGKEAKRWGTAHSSIVPYQLFQTKDSYCAIGAGSDSQFEKLCGALHRDDLASNPKFKDNESRVQHREELIQVLNEIFKTRTTKEWLTLLKDTGCPMGPLNNMQQTFTHPQVHARDMVVDVDHPEAGAIKLVGPAVKYSRTPAQVRTHPPLLGEHTEEVLKELGYDDNRIQELRIQNVV